MNLIVQTEMDGTFNGHLHRNQKDKIMKRLVLSTAILVAGCGAAFGQATIAMSGTVSPTYQLILSQGTGGPTLGGGTTAATIAVGTILFYGTSSNATGVTQTNTGDTHGTDTGTIALSFPVNIEVDKANSASANFTLNAYLAAAAVTNTTVTMGGTTLTTTAADTALTTAGVYGTAAAYTVGVNVGTGVLQSASPLGQTINITFTPA
jgi:hypothetical protein